MAMCSTITHSPTFSLYNQWSLKISLKCHIESENACKNNLIRLVFRFSQIPICHINKKCWVDMNENKYHCVTSWLADRIYLF